MARGRPAALFGTVRYTQQLQRASIDVMRKSEHREKPTENKGSSAICCYCGRTGHGSRIQERSKKCPAFGKKCTKCGINNHFANVCRQSSHSPANPAPSSSPNVLDDSAAAFECLCSVSEAALVSDGHAVLLDYHEYNDFVKPGRSESLTLSSSSTSPSKQYHQTPTFSASTHPSKSPHPPGYPPSDCRQNVPVTPCRHGAPYQVGAGLATPPSRHHEDDSSKSRSHGHH